MTTTILDRLIALLEQHNVPFERMEHEAVYTSEEAARVRRTTLSSGAKALICKSDERYLMFVVPADRKLDSRAVRRSLGARQLRFATAEEVLQLTGLRPGSIPPFGSLFNFRTYCDEQLAVEPRINFNAGDHCVSLSLAFSDYRTVEQPVMGQFAESTAR
jgi:Ala-tRNA(Pro) deacylase